MNQDTKIEMLDVDTLIPYARNARTHSEAQVAEIASSIKEFGWTNPILIDDEQGVIAGHGRLMAARKLGLKTVPVIRLTGLDEIKKRAYILADNRIALNSGWDVEMLGLELEDLKDQVDLDSLGFSEAEITSLLDDGWGSDIGGIEHIESHLEAIKERITIKLDGTFVEEIKGVISSYCDEHAINVEIS